MTWSHVAAACGVACIAASFTDWLFFGVFFHEKYMAFPEVWRRPPGAAGEGRAVGLAIVVGFLTPLCFVLSCYGLHIADARAVTLLVVGTWAMTALPLLVINYLFMKMHPLIVVAHSLGWLAKLAVSGIAVVWFMG